MESSRGMATVLKLVGRIEVSEWVESEKDISARTLFCQLVSYHAKAQVRRFFAGLSVPRFPLRVILALIGGAVI